MKLLFCINIKEIKSKIENKILIYLIKLNLL